MLRLIAVCLALALPAAAQESVVTGISTDTIALNATFEGSDLFVFGAIRRSGPLPPDAGPLDIIITIKGPPEPVVVRRKDRVLGLWLNTAAVRVNNVPSFYAIAATRPVDVILSETEQLRYGIGIEEAVRLVGSHPTITDTGDFAEALARIRLASGSYAVLQEGVSLAEDTLFQARFELPANLIEGDYDAEFFLVRNEAVVNSGTTIIRVQKTGIQRWIFHLAHNAPLAYGALAIAVALAAGWLAAAAFRFLRR